MSVPEFTAEASLYRTSGRYRSSGSEGSVLWSGESIVPAYYPGTATQANCNRCLKTAQKNFGWCLGIGGAGCGLGCIAAGPFYAACFASCMGGVLATCDVNLLRESAACALDDCCPKACGTPNPFDPGAGCCDKNEQCVDRYDPNSRGGCCPSDQIVCGGKCCAKGESCCGETCCPAGYFCRDGWICESQFIGSFPTTPPPPAPVNNCIFGGVPCGSKCCPPGLECCGLFSNGQPDCKMSCLH